MKILCFVDGAFGDSHVVHALAMNGAHLESHVSSSIEWAKHDIGVTSERKHDLYRKEFPDGYELVWLDSTDNDLWREAYARNQALAPERTPDGHRV